MLRLRVIENLNIFNLQPNCAEKTLGIVFNSFCFLKMLELHKFLDIDGFSSLLVINCQKCSLFFGQQPEELEELFFYGFFKAVFLLYAE